MHCFSIEEKAINLIKKHYRLLFFIIITLISMLIRYYGRGIYSIDMTDFLLPWFKIIKDGGGFHSLTTQVGDYNLLYQTLIALGTYITDNAFYYYKILSILGDYVLALSCAYTVSRLSNKSLLKDNTFYVIYSCVILLPTVVLNSSFWGQCDCLYTVFLIWTLYFLYQKKYRAAFIVYGVAFAFKLQSIFLLPFIILLYFSEKKFSLLNLIFSGFTFWLSGLVAFLYGRPLLAPFDIYFKQTERYKRLFMNFESFWKFLGDSNQYNALAEYAILLTLGILGLALYAVLAHNIVFHSYKDYLLCASWIIWTVLLFLPAMHERYSYPLDLLLILLAFFNIKYAIFAFWEILISISTYGRFLFGLSGYEEFFSVLEIVLWFAFTCICYYTFIYKKKERESNYGEERKEPISYRNPLL